MYTQFDEKGKIFTNVVTKKPVQVIIQTTAQRIRGEVHVRPNMRLLDALKEEGEFLAVTGATVFGPDGRPLYTGRFLSVNQSHIVWVLPVEEMGEAGGKE